MRITNNTNLSTVNSITKFNFCAGYTKLYTDFDGTYFPFSQESIVYHDNESIKKANQMYSAFRETAGVSGTTHTIMDNLDKMNTADADRALKKIKNTIRIGDSQSGNISDSTVRKIIKEFGINPSDVK